MYIIKQTALNLKTQKPSIAISFPVDILYSYSFLQRTAASFGCAPQYLRSVANSHVLEQIKSVIGFLMSIPPIQLAIFLPFNPIIGQTFSAYLGGIPIYFQQISVQPLITSYYMVCQQFQLYGNIQPVINIHLNRITYQNTGKIHIIMQNGNHFQLNSFPIQISGLLYGKKQHTIYNKAFIIQRNHRILAQLSIIKQSKNLYQHKNTSKPTMGDIIGGIFKIKQKSIKQLSSLKTLSNYPGLKPGNITDKLSSISGIWFSTIFIDDQPINIGKIALPVQYWDNSLPSDSNFRMDVLMHRLGDLARAETEKEILENQQICDRKLRDKYSNIKRK